MSIVVTAATGQLGRLVVQSLLARGVPAPEIVAAARRPDALEPLERLGVRTARLDYDDAATAETALAGARRVLLVSGTEFGRRVAQHTTVIEAARRAGVEQLVYTSAPHASTGSLVVLPEHRATEEAIAASGVPATLLRNNWYTENYLGAVTTARATGELLSSAGDGRVASASRADYAEAAAAVLTGPLTPGEGHLGRVYELAGDTAWTFADLAATIADLIGAPVTLRRLGPDAHRRALLAAGLDEATTDFVVTMDRNIRDGELATATGELSTLIGRPTTPLADGLALALKEQDDRSPGDPR